MLGHVARARLRASSNSGASTFARLAGPGDPLLDLADAGEVLIDLLLVGAAQAVLQVGGLLGDEIEHALPDAVAAG